MTIKPLPILPTNTAIANLAQPQRLQIIWLTNDSFDGDIPPEQSNLAAVVQAAIDRFTEG